LQYILLILGVAIGVAMMVSIDLANGSARRAFALSTDAVTGKATHRIVGGSTGVDEAIYRRLRQEVGFSPAAPVVEGYVSSTALGDRPLRLVGIDPFAEPPFRNYFGAPGANGFGATDETSTGMEGLTLLLTEPNAIILSQDTAARHGLAPGDRLPLATT
jgi:putative ABC transport system permease protein